jgi:hypothetical protein
MAYQATIIPVMIASPGDVREERAIIRSVIYDWNDINAAAAQVFLAPVGWETHSSPELGTRAQELINTRILKDCDLLVGVFWTRLGSPTGNATSGTVEEIQEHIAAGKPAMIYFSSRPVAPDSIDAQQYANLKSFKAECQGNGLTEHFDSADELRAKFVRQLSICVAKAPYLQSLLATSSASSSSLASAPDASTVSARLSEDAKSLLKAAASGTDGAILKAETLARRQLFVGDLSFGGDGARDYAKWDSAFRQLFEEDLIIERGDRGIIFELTYLGWTVANQL